MCAFSLQPPRSAVRGTSDDDRALLAVLAGQRIALPLSAIAAVAPLDTIVPLPLAPAYVRGVATWRGHVVPVLDLSPLFGAPALVGDLAAIVQQGEAVAAVLVEEVYGEATLARTSAVGASAPAANGAAHATLHSAPPDLVTASGLSTIGATATGESVHVLNLTVLFALAHLSAVFG